MLHIIRPSRGADLVRALFGERRPRVWISDSLGSQRGHSELWQMCLAHLLRVTQYAIDCGDAAFAAALKRLLLRAIAIGQHLERGLIKPDDFIPAAETSTVIADLTLAVLAMSLDQERAWRDRWFDVPIAVNLSARVLDDVKLAGRILAMLADRGLPLDSLILELTETALITAPDRAAATLRALSDAGVRVSLDDFGAGYTSFKQLRELDIAELKIDARYVT